MQYPLFDAFVRAFKRFWDAPRDRPSKHAGGRRKPPGYRRRLNTKRKRERQARRYARLCASGKKHRWKGAR